MNLRRVPLFVQVAEILRSEILPLAAGSKLETDQGLSRRFSVSVSVIREALSVLSRDGLIYRKVGRGTFVAERKCNFTKPIAILCDLDLHRIPFPAYILQRVQVAKQLLESRGFEVAIYLGDHVPTIEPPRALTCRQFLKDLAAKRLGGVLSVWAMPHMEWTSLIEEQGLPHVGFGLLHEKMVSFDFETFLRYALRILKARGRRRIAYINGVGEWNLDGHDQERRKRVSAIFQEESVEVRNAWMIQEWHRNSPGAGWSSFREVWTSYADRPDAVILGNSFLLKEVKESACSLNVNIPVDLDLIVPRSKANGRVPFDDPSVIPLLFDPAPLVEAGVEMIVTLLSGKLPDSTRRFVDVWDAPFVTHDCRPSSLLNVPL